MPDEDGNTALMMCAVEGHVTAAEFLLARGADVNQSNIEGKTPCILAAMYGQHGVLKCFIKAGANLNEVY